MKKKSYPIVDVKSIRLPDVQAELSTSKRAVLGIDMAKSEAVVSIGGAGVPGSTEIEPLLLRRSDRGSVGRHPDPAGRESTAT